MFILCNGEKAIQLAPVGKVTAMGNPLILLWVMILCGILFAHIGVTLFDSVYGALISPVSMIHYGFDISVVMVVFK